MLRMSRRRIAIIGGGASGLTAIKCCLDEGLEPVCFEKEPELGGLWNYTDEPKPGTGSVYKSCVINTSKEMFAFSDFPVPAEFPPFMSHRYVMKYLRMYAEHFDLMSHIRFETTVENIRKSPNFAEDGRWVIGRRNTDDNEAETREEVYDGVMVCTGHHVHPVMPDIPGMTQYKGVQMHSRDYKVPEAFMDKDVLVVGIGNSAVDIAVDLSRVASQVYVSTRRGAWVVGKMGPLGIPMDMLANSRFAFTFPRAWLQKMVEVFTNFKFDHETFGLKPNHRVLESHPTINDDLPLRILTGSIKIKPAVTSLSSSSAIFDDDTEEHVDGVIYATGYDYISSVITSDVMDIVDNKTTLYKYMYPPSLEQPTLAMIGLVQPVGAILPVAEIQCRWFARVLNGSSSLPDKSTMMADIRKKRHFMDRSYYSARKHSCETFWIEYMDEIADQFGAKPNLSRMALTDPLYAARCFFGPCVPAQYRIQGPGRWSGARGAVGRTFSNTSNVTKTRKMAPVIACDNARMTDLLLCLLVIGMCVFLHQVGLFFL